jgi:hypothetical protein
MSSSIPERGIVGADWEQLLQPLGSQEEGWQDGEPEDERDPLGEARPVEGFTAEVTEVQEWTR